MVVALRYDIKRWGRIITRVIGDDNGAFLMFPLELGDQGEVPCAVKRPLYLGDELPEEER